MGKETSRTGLKSEETTENRRQPRDCEAELPIPGHIFPLPNEEAAKFVYNYPESGTSQGQIKLHQRRRKLSKNQRFPTNPTANRQRLLLRKGRHGLPEQGETTGQLPGLDPHRQKPIMANTHKALGKHMLKEAAHEFQAVKGHKLVCATIAVIFVGKGDHTGSRLKGLNPRSGNRRAVGILRQIADHMRGRIQGLLQMDMKGETGKQLLEGRLQGEGRIQLRKKEAAEDFGKRLGREEEVLRGMNKGSPGSRQTASGNEYMEMGMKLKGLTPGMKNGGEAGRETEKTLGSG